MNSYAIWEWLGVATALIYVYLATKGHRSCFVFGLISSVVFVEICLTEKLYYDTAINAYYVVMSMYGWWHWKKEEGHFHADSLSNVRFALYAISIVFVSLIVGFLSQNYTDASMPYLDSFTTISAIAATWLMVQKILQNWLIWIIADTVSVYMYHAKGHQPMAMLFIIYTLIAVYGFFQWRKKVLVHA